MFKQQLICLVLRVVGWLYGDDLDEAVEYLVKKHPEIQVLKIENSNITDTGLEAILIAENIKTIDLGSERLTGTGFKSQANFSKHIQSLTLRARNMSIQGIIQILQHCGKELITLGILCFHLTT